MSVNYSPSHAQGFTSEGSVTQDKLFDRETLTRKVRILRGSGTYLRGTLLGRVLDGARTAVGAAGSPAPAGATISASPVATSAADVGVHRFVCVTAGVTGKWDHYAPGGQKVGQATTGTEYVGGGLTLTITDSGTDPAKDEEFTVTVTEAAATGYYTKSLAAATDGSEAPDAILLHDVVLESGAEVDAIVAIKGRFNGGALILGAGHSLASIDAGLRGKNIFLETIVG